MMEAMPSRKATASASPLNRRFGYELDRIDYLGSKDKNGKPLTVLKMKDDGTVDLLASLNDNKITNFVKNDDGLWGNASGDNKTVFTLKETAPTDEELADSLYTRYEVEFNITDHRYFMFYFKEKSTYYVTYSGGKEAMGTPPAAEIVEEGDAFVIPTNRTLFYKGNTLDHWEDEGGNVYNIDSTYIATASDLRLFPVFMPNKFDRLDVTEGCDSHMGLCHQRRSAYHRPRKGEGHSRHAAEMEQPSHRRQD